MSDEEEAESPPRTSWRERLALAMAGRPRTGKELRDLLRVAERRELLDSEALRIIEGALTVADMQAREIMVPRSQAVFLRLDDSTEQLLDAAIKSGHSRFPVTGENPDDVIGILLAKDLLPLAVKGKKPPFNLRDLLRPCAAIPESKRLNVLLQEFRAKHNHLAVVVDEYGSVCGIVTIEDVLEQIVGEIEDEHDQEDAGYFKQRPDGTYAVKALAPIEDFNERFGAALPAEEFDTIGGLVTNAFGRLPDRDEEITVEGFRFKVANADGRRVHLLSLTLP